MAPFSLTAAFSALTLQTSATASAPVGADEKFTHVWIYDAINAMHTQY